MILESPGQPATTLAPSIQSDAPIPTWFKRWVNATTWEVSKSTRPTRIMYSPSNLLQFRQRLQQLLNSDWRRKRNGNLYVAVQRLIFQDNPRAKCTVSHLFAGPEAIARLG